MAAVRTLLVASSRPCVTLNFPSGTQPRMTANSAARSPTSNACAYIAKLSILALRMHTIDTIEMDTIFSP